LGTNGKISADEIPLGRIADLAAERARIRLKGNR
jgi:hypothetical protein